MGEPSMERVMETRAAIADEVGGTRMRMRTADSPELQGDGGLRV